MRALIYFLLALFILSIGWALSIGAIAAIVWLLWFIAAKAWMWVIDLLVGYVAFGATLPYLLSPLQITFDLLFWLALSVGVLLGLTLLSLFRPSGWSVKQFSKPYAIEQLSKEDPLWIATHDIAKRMNISMPSVYLIHQPEVNAYAVSTLFGSSVGISVALMRRLSLEEAAWVMAHELVHIKNRDSFSKSFWISGLQISAFGFRLKDLLDRTIVGVFGRIFRGILWPVAYLTRLILVFFSRVLIHIFKLFRYVFSLFTRALDRSIEFRCDAIGSQFVDPMIGVAVLQKIDSGWEQPTRIAMSTHPSAWDRIARLSQQSRGKE